MKKFPQTVSVAALLHAVASVYCVSRLVDLGRHPVCMYVHVCVFVCIMHVVASVHYVHVLISFVVETRVVACIYLFMHACINPCTYA